MTATTLDQPAVRPEGYPSQTPTVPRVWRRTRGYPHLCDMVQVIRTELLEWCANSGRRTSRAEQRATSISVPSVPSIAPPAIEANTEWIETPGIVDEFGFPAHADGR